MAKESLQKKLDRVRKPRVQIKYEVYTGDAMELKELPFVMGILSDLSGRPDKPLPALKDRKFIDIDRDNFNKVLAGIAPRLAYRVDDKLSGKEGSQLNVELRFKDMDDFSPENVVRQIEPLRQLLEQRDRLKDLLGKMEGNDKLEELLQQIMQDAEARSKLSSELGIGQNTPETQPSGEEA